MKVSACTHHSGAFLSLGTGRNQGGSPRSQGHARVCAHAYALSWQHPPWGEASTCPIPEQGAGAATRPQLGRPDSGERNEGGGHSCPGGLAQELEPSRSDLQTPPRPSFDYRWPDQKPGFRVFRGPKSQPLAVLMDKSRPKGARAFPWKQNPEHMQILFS